MNEHSTEPKPADLLPLSPDERTWDGRTIVCLWAAAAVCAPTYMLTAEMLDQGMSWWQAVLAVSLGSFLAWIPMAIIGRAGAVHGVAFPLLLRSSFGTRGARLAVGLRSVAGVLWFSLQLWIGAHALALIGSSILGPGSLGAPLPVIGLSPGELVALVAFAALHLWVLQGGMTRIATMVRIAAPALGVLLGAVVLWAFVQDEKGFNTMWTSPSQFGEYKELEGQFWQVFLPMLAAATGVWTLLAINIVDFTRQLARPRGQAAAQLMGLMAGMTLVSLVGVTVTYASTDIFGETLDGLRMADPVVVIQGMGWLGGLLGMTALLLASLSTNVTVHGVGPIYGMMSIWPARLGWSSAARLLAVLALALLPWKLLAASGGGIYVGLVGLSYLLAPIAGILCWDCWAMRRAPLQPDALLDDAGPYGYGNGWNARAVIAFLCALVPLLPGFAETVGLVGDESIPDALEELYRYATPFGFVVGAVVFAILQRFGRSPDSA